MSKEDIEKAMIFVAHLEKHMKEAKARGEDWPHFRPMCKICGKTIDEIYEEVCKGRKNG